MTAPADAGIPIAVQRFIDAAIGRRPGEAQQIVRDTLTRRGSVDVIEQLLGPALIHIGERWLAAAITSTDEHRVSAAVDDALDLLERSDDGVYTGSSLGVSTGVGDWHPTAARMATHRLRSAGWDARFIGVSLDATPLAETRELGSIEAVALSCVAAPHLVDVARTIRGVHAAGLPVMVGGQAFIAGPRRSSSGCGCRSRPATPPADRQYSWLTVRPWEQPPSSVDARLDALLELDLGTVTQQLREELGALPIVTDTDRATALPRPTVNAWASAVAVTSPASSPSSSMGDSFTRRTRRIARSLRSARGRTAIAGAG